MMQIEWFLFKFFHENQKCYLRFYSKIKSVTCDFHAFLLANLCIFSEQGKISRDKIRVVIRKILFFKSF